MTITRSLAFGSLAALAAGVMPLGVVAHAAEGFPRLAEPAATPPAAARPGETPPPIPPEAQAHAVWYAVIDGEQVGPMTEDALLARLDRGEIDASTLIWRSGMAQWQAVADIQPIMAKRIAAAIRNWQPETPLDEKYRPYI